MKTRYYVQCSSKRWCEVNYTYYLTHKGKKLKSPFNILNKLNEGRI